MSSGPKDVSVVVPFYEEESAAPALVAEVRQVLVGLGKAYELILVDDGSRDSTHERLLEAARGDDDVQVLRLARNFGQTAALAAGVDRCRGEVIVLMDGDGQNDPSDIPGLLERLEEGYDLVSGWRKGRKDPFFTRRLPSLIANGLIARVTGVQVRDLGCSLKAYRRANLQNLQLYGEMHRFLAVHAAWEGARFIEVPVGHRRRAGGRSKYGLERTFKVLLDLIVMLFLKKYGTKPIYPFGGFGLLSFFGAFLAGLAAIGFKLAPAPYHKDFVESPLPLLVVMLGLVGALAIMLGLLAEMLTRTYHEAQNKSVYRVASIERPGDAPPSGASVPAAEATEATEAAEETEAAGSEARV